jgi:hypothetical protein
MTKPVNKLCQVSPLNVVIGGRTRPPTCLILSPSLNLAAPQNAPHPLDLAACPAMEPRRLAASDLSNPHIESRRAHAAIPPPDWLPREGRRPLHSRAALVVCLLAARCWKFSGSLVPRRAELGTTRASEASMCYCVTRLTRTCRLHTTSVGYPVLGAPPTVIYYRTGSALDYVFLWFLTRGGLKGGLKGRSGIDDGCWAAGAKQ